jgi:hypothetical protein
MKNRVLLVIAAVIFKAETWRGIWGKAKEILQLSSFRTAR